ncbi:MAG: AAA domain-containing protein, partial [Ignavibacteriales bacterium]|nr:AAA domain-containing protein [Ignavibacteriales bacterium]
MRDDANDAALVGRLRDAVEKLRTEIGKAIVGQTTVVERIVAALLCRGHVLLVGAPGLAKTLMIRTLADALDLKFGRIQFTPDLMPSDIT